jgi:hypothetical protein
MENEEAMYQKGKLYQWNGSEFVELEPSSETKIPVSEEAMDAVKRVRKAAQALVKLRPELSLTASAMLLAAADLSNVAELVQSYGQRVYGGATSHVTADDITPEHVLMESLNSGSSQVTT